MVRLVSEDAIAPIMTSFKWSKKEPWVRKMAVMISDNVVSFKRRLYWKMSANIKHFSSPQYIGTFFRVLVHVPSRAFYKNC